MNAETPNEQNRPHVVIIGAGFGGIWAAKELADQPVRVTLLDKNNYHTFLPLLYQVAAAEIEPEQIGYPVRGILRRLPNVTFTLAEVTAVNPTAQTVTTTRSELAYDYLILATGSITQFFGTPGAAAHAFSLKTMEEGVRLRNHILTCFERAVHATVDERRQLLTFVVVGGGPTGVEYAGALSELVYGPLRRDFPELDMAEVSIVLLEAAGRVLGGMSESLSDYAARSLQKMKVAVQLEKRVTAVSGTAVTLHDDSQIPTNTVIWVAGVGGEALAKDSGVEVLGNGRVPVLPTLQLPQHERVFAIGDLAAFPAEGSGWLPMVAQVAIQQGIHAAQNIGRHQLGLPLNPFHYWDKGSMATIGRNKAVVDWRGRAFTGFLAWLIWGVIHIMYLIGFRNRIMVMLSWAWRYFTFEQTVRLIMPSNAAGWLALAPEERYEKSTD
ncbi:MAG TPA: NAD(P)/FAD-dependent oxidoreductase [Chloroflexota bacterium]|nr:NAD(P)/FAD-dependent oxidoreductase [Chloroflexota bacterium]